ncbi:MAG: carboxypeptidase-like regulatory domain-containing protein [Terriglobia bacterium]
MRVHPVLKALVLAGVIALSVTSEVRADDIYGRIRGTVTDPTGAVVPDVPVTATNVATGVVRSVRTGSAGTFEFANLPAPAVYNVTVERTGFKRFEATSIQLALNQIYVLDVALELGTTAQEVTVEANRSQVETTSMELGARITGSAIVNLPLNGRDWIELQTTLPGVVSSMGDFADAYSTSGSRAQDNEFLLNGVDNIDLALNVVSAIPSPDSIGEVNMITNTINPEYGRNGGAVMNAVTKSGSNQFHGDAFEFYRDTFLNARNFFQSSAAVFHRNQFGGTLGGPIWKNHTFFFFSYQGTRDRQPDTPGRSFAGPTVNVLTQSQRNGDFPDVTADTNVLGTPTLSPFPLVGENGQTYPAGTPYSTLFPNGQIPSADFSAPAVKLISTYMPLPNTGTNAFTWSPISTDKFYQYISRIDHNFGPKDTLTGYWFIENDTTVDDQPFIGGSLPGFAEDETERIQNMALTWNHTFGTSMINEARVGYNRLGYNSVNPVKPVLPSTFGFDISPQSGPSGAGIPCIDMNDYEPPSGACEFGFSYDGPQPRIDQTYQVSDNFTWIKGPHSFKLGFDMRRAEVSNPFYFVNNGYFQFYGEGAFSTGDEAADFLLGIPDFYEQTSGGFIDARTQEYYSYFQDQWKARSNLTLTYGVGWQVNAPQNDIFNGGVAVNAYRPGVQSTVYPSAPPGLLFPGDAGISESTYGTSFKHFAPRLGFAWSPGSDHKWSIRGGFGIYYNQIEEELTLQNLESPPFSLTDYGTDDIGVNPSLANPYSGYAPSYDASGNLVGATPVTLSNRFPYTPPRPGDKNVDFSFFYPMTVKVFDPKLTTPSAYNYNFTIQRELPSSIILQVGYVGHQGRHLEDRENLDPAGQAPGVNPVCAAGPACGYGTLGFTEPQTLANPLTENGSLVFGGVGVQATDANSNYNSLQISATKRTTHGLEFQSSYTWSHSLDPISSVENVGGGGQPNPFNRQDNYGDSAYDARQRFVISYTYTIPSIRRYNSFRAVPSRLVEGWKISGITTLQAGFPISLTDSSYNSLTCWAYSGYGCADRPNVLGPVRTYDPRNANLVNTNQGGTTTLANYYFNPNDFTSEVRGLLGDAGRNFFHGPGINNFDFGLYKDTKITESTKIELRLESFNVFNHAQFGSVGNDVNSPSFFGRSTAAADPRIIQLAAKFYF